jgi:hypothetical protein
MTRRLGGPISNEAVELGPACVLGDSGVDVQRQRKSCAALLARDARRIACAYAFQERFDLQVQRLAGGYGGLGECQAAENAGRIWRSSVMSGLRLDVDKEQILPRVVDGDVLMRLEEAKLADALGTDAAGGEVGDAAGGKFDADVGDIHLARQDGQADGLQGANRRPDKTKDDVEIMHHEVENDVDIEGAWRENAEPVRLKEHGHVDVGLYGKDGWVEALQMANLKDAAMPHGQIDERVCLGQRRGDRLFYQNIDAGLKQCASDRRVGAGGYTHGGGVELDLAGGARGEAGVYVREEAGLRKIGLQCLPARGIAFDDSHKTEGIARSCAQFADHPEMIAAEGAGTDDGEPDGWWRGGRHLNYWAPLLPPTTARQRV